MNITNFHMVEQISKPVWPITVTTAIKDCWLYQSEYVDTSDNVEIYFVFTVYVKTKFK